MDIEYLLRLQEIRSGTPELLISVIDFVTKISVSAWPLAILLMIYWVFDRKSGKHMLAGLSIAMLINGLLKLIICAYRPWIRDARIEPYGDSKVAATGYSFPSGHSTLATVYWGGIGFWFRDRNKTVTAVLYLLVLLTMFSRNFLGVHTPQDVIAGFGSTVLVLVISVFLENWTDEDPDKRDIIYLVSALVVCILLALFYQMKSYPMDYNTGGALIVDPMEMKPDSYSGIGLFGAYAVCRFFERRGFAFDEEINWKDRFIVGAFAIPPLFWWYYHIESIMKTCGLLYLGEIIWGAGIIVYAMIIVPVIMRKVNDRGLLGQTCRDIKEESEWEKKEAGIEGETVR